jgi:hypothetical protein
MNLFDAYVQYANSEGLGMPAVEAGACGVPVMEVDYSAMSDVVRKLGGYPIRLAGKVRESETHCWRAVPDNGDLVDKLIAFLSKPEAVRAGERYRVRKAVEAHYTYDKAARVWEDHFDSVPSRDGLWESPPRVHSPATEVPAGLSDEEFVRWGIHQVAGRPELANSYMAMRMARDLYWGVSLPHMGGLYFNEMSTLGTIERRQRFDRELCHQELLKLGEQKNFWERRRTS